MNSNKCHCYRKGGIALAIPADNAIAIAGGKKNFCMSRQHQKYGVNGKIGIIV
jgi:hypothetical protein